MRCFLLCGSKPIRDFRDFIFIDLGSGKGRALLMASDYPFRRIVGVELLPQLHRAAQDNLTKYRSEFQQCFVVQSICANAAEFRFPEEPIVLYLFNPLPEPGLRRALTNLKSSLRRHPRTVYAVSQPFARGMYSARARRGEKLAGRISTRSTSLSVRSWLARNHLAADYAV